MASCARKRRLAGEFARLVAAVDLLVEERGDELGQRLCSRWAVRSWAAALVYKAQRHELCKAADALALRVVGRGVWLALAGHVRGAAEVRRMVEREHQVLAGISRLESARRLRRLAVTNCAWRDVVRVWGGARHRALEQVTEH